ncbi:hypothetical protein [Pedobacter psychroterrae]|uniref:Uncharacterized protein n=1 Tax=Pedobacter psychroterrae TaxID=2530453 RepID=A0A4R0NE37_9SPHI|nr:hypothetical protein [Pedobacter psychroterrae]TCC96804.1 hypothetical protein EZ437_20660 [Pedobacter psychroterrae]
MGYAKERGKLEKLSAKITGLTIYDDKSLAVITDIYEQYSHTIRILKNKDADTFMELYQNELQQVKELKKALKLSEHDEDRQLNFIKYKDGLSDVLVKTIQVSMI